GFMYWLAMAARCLPTGIDPVKVTSRMLDCGIRYSEILAGSPNTRLSTPGGKPASAKARASCTAPAGVSSDALRMIEQPADSAPPTLRAGELIGNLGRARRPEARHQGGRRRHLARHLHRL